MRACLVLTAFVMLAACASTTTSSDSKSNWLRMCAKQGDCAGQGFSCSCGVCTKPCQSAAVCDSRPAETVICINPSDQGIADACQSVSQAAAKGICLVSCLESSQCGKQQRCLHGVCMGPAPNQASPDSGIADGGFDSATAAAGPDGSPPSKPVDSGAEATEGGEPPMRPVDASLGAEHEACETSNQCQSGLVCSQQSCRKNPCAEASCAMIPLAPVGDASCKPAASTRVACNGRSCAAGLVCHMDNTCIEPGACDQNGIATLIDSTDAYVALYAIDEHYLYGTATRNGQPTILRWSTSDAAETVVAQGRDANPQRPTIGSVSLYPGHIIVDAKQVYWIGPKPTLDGTTLLWRVAKDGSAMPVSAGSAGALLAQDEGYLYMSGIDGTTLFRARKDAPDGREPIYAAPAGESLIQVAVNGGSVFVDETNGNGKNAVRMIDKLTLASSLLPIESEGVLTPSDDYLYVVGNGVFTVRYNFATEKAVPVPLQGDLGDELTPLANRIIAYEVPRGASSINVSSVDPVTGVETPLAALPFSSTASGHASVSTAALFPENIDNRVLKFMLPPL